MLIDPEIMEAPKFQAKELALLSMQWGGGNMVNVELQEKLWEEAIK